MDKQEVIEALDSAILSAASLGTLNLVSALERIRAYLTDPGYRRVPVDIVIGQGDVIITDFHAESESGIAFISCDGNEVGKRYPELEGAKISEVRGRIFSVRTSNLRSMLVLKDKVDRAVSMLSASQGEGE